MDATPDFNHTSFEEFHWQMICLHSRVSCPPKIDSWPCNIYCPNLIPLLSLLIRTSYDCLMTPSHFSLSDIRLKSGVCNVCHSAFHRRRCSPTLWPLWVIYLVREWAYVAWTWRCVGYLGGGRFTTGVVDDRSVCGEFSSVFLSHFQCSKLIRADKSGPWKRRSMCWLVIKAFLSAYLVKFSRTCCSINGQCCES
jgi:hypothetical protein